MKKIMFLFVLIFTFSCINLYLKMFFVDYKTVVPSGKVSFQYDSALIEMYRLNSCCTCDCMAKSDDFSKPDTQNILSLELALADSIMTNDTTTFFFKFYRIFPNGDTVFYSQYGKSYTDCCFNGISFKGKSSSPFPIFLGEFRIIDFSDSFRQKSISNFNECLKKDSLSKTLRYYFD